MTKFNEKSLHGYPNVFFFSAMQTFDDFVAGVETEQQRFIDYRSEHHLLFQAFDAAYKQSMKSELSDEIKKKDDERDSYAWVMKHVADLWAQKLTDDALNIHGRRVAQVFKDFEFRTSEALLAENAKIVNIEQRFAEETLAADLAAMGLTELNQRMRVLTVEISALMQQRTEEQSAIQTGEVHDTREALDANYRAFITYANALQEIAPEESISLAAQYYNEALQKLDVQIAQSHKRKKKEPTPTPDPEPKPEPEPEPEE